ncbi:MAG: DNA-deoxyinosine glycosylase [Tissierellia bacterium]|nr:DNA-deoxyinosine glycosylase [Tissierellia bacterium]
MIKHNFPPIFDENSKILILGSFPSVVSREIDFYYGNPRNRFWPLMAELLKTKKPTTTEERIKLLLDNRIALYDAMKSAEITGSMDKDIRNYRLANIGDILGKSNIVNIYCNGRKAYDVVTKEMKYNAILLPSTSPANARYGFEKLLEAWKIILHDLKR